MLKVICSPTTWFEPDGNAEHLLRWVLDNGAEVTWFYNGKFDWSVLVRALGVDLESDGPKRSLFLEEHKVVVGSYVLSMIGAKSCRVEEMDALGKVVRKIECFDAASFFTNDEARVSLDEAGKTFLGEGKNAEALGVDRVKIGTVEGYYEANRERIIEYCRQDANVTKKLGEYLVDRTGEALGFWPTRWSSAASLSKAWLGRYHPEISARAKGDFKIFRRSFRGALFITRILGRVPHQDELDLRQAYTAAILELPSMEGLVLRRRVDEKGLTISPDAVYGCYLVGVPFDGKLGFRLSDLVGIRDWDPKEQAAVEQIFYPDSDGEPKPYWANLVELRYFDEEGIPYTIVSADELCGVPKGKALADIQPLADKVVALKKAAKTDPKAKTMRETFKRVVNATFGCLAESKHGTTPFTTWPMAAYITSKCRVSVWRQWRAVERGRGSVVSVNADSIRYVKGDYEIPTTPAIGDFSVKFADATVTHYGSGRALIEHRWNCDCGDCHTSEGRPKASRLLPSQRFHPELHATECECPRCERAPVVTLRKRGFPNMNAGMLLKAKGYAMEIVQKRPLTINEGVIQRRMKDVGDIPDSEADIDAEDGARRREFNLLSNLRIAVYDPRELTFERLNQGAVIGIPMPYDAVFQDRWVKEALAMREYAESGLLTAGV